MPGTLEEDQPRDTRTDTYTHAEADTTVSIASGRQVHHDCRALLVIMVSCLPRNTNKG